MGRVCSLCGLTEEWHSVETWADHNAASGRVSSTRWCDEHRMYEEDCPHGSSRTTSPEIRTLTSDPSSSAGARRPMQEGQGSSCLCGVRLGRYVEHRVYCPLAPMPDCQHVLCWPHQTCKATSANATAR